MITEDVVKLMEKAKELGVKQLAWNGLEVSFNTTDAPVIPPLKVRIPAAVDPVPEVKAEDLFKPMSPFDNLSPDEILYYATPHFDELQAQKKAHEEQLKTEVKTAKER